VPLLSDTIPISSSTGPRYSPHQSRQLKLNAGASGGARNERPARPRPTTQQPETNPRATPLLHSRTSMEAQRLRTPRRRPPGTIRARLVRLVPPLRHAALAAAGVAAAARLARCRPASRGTLSRPLSPRKTTHTTPTTPAMMRRLAKIRLTVTSNPETARKIAVATMYNPAL